MAEEAAAVVEEPSQVVGSWRRASAACRTSREATPMLTAAEAAAVPAWTYCRVAQAMLLVVGEGVEEDRCHGPGEPVAMRSHGLEEEPPET